ncbi:hypothetical protein AB0E96_24160 [Kitasatospora sp. NPDC036755]|uniref:hypothetical protein n=1 Tax=Kitasatospora sp. NPDC036755 TaxID=3154600 RepID=UPI0033DB88DD
MRQDWEPEDLIKVWTLLEDDMKRMRNIAAARGAAIRQQLLELPAPVVADALGYHDKTTSRLRNETGGTWSRCAAGDHGRSPVGWAPETTGES